MSEEITIHKFKKYIGDLNTQIRGTQLTIDKLKGQLTDHLTSLANLEHHKSFVKTIYEKIIEGILNGQNTIAIEFNIMSNKGVLEQSEYKELKASHTKILNMLEQLGISGARTYTKNEYSRIGKAQSQGQDTITIRKLRPSQDTVIVFDV